MTIRCLAPLVLSVIPTELRAHARPFPPYWGSLRVEHASEDKNTVLGYWESVGHPPAGATIGLRIALKS